MPNVVIKKGNRCQEQYEFLNKYKAAQCLPEVGLPVGCSPEDNIYVMNRLIEVETKNSLELTHMLYSALNEDLWKTQTGNDDYVEYNETAHIAKVLPLLKIGVEFSKDPEKSRARALEVHNICSPQDIDHAVTHGDPTFDNLMMLHGLPVLIDPLVATPAVPSDIAVDVGKILTSLGGFEQVRYNKIYKNRRDAKRILKNAVINDYGEKAWIRSLYWCGIHMYRAVPYMKSPRVKKGLVEIANESFKEALRF